MSEKMSERISENILDRISEDIILDGKFYFFSKILKHDFSKIPEYISKNKIKKYQIYSYKNQIFIIIV